MNQHFSQLSEAEYQKLKDAFAQITVLIAGADGSIEEEETAWAQKITNIRSYKMVEDLKEFYSELSAEFLQKVNQFTTLSSAEPAARNASISASLAELNPILAKLDVKTGAILYSGLKTFATHVAKSTGGLFGFFSIDKSEKALLGLPMIHPIIDPEAETEEE
jgi:hypothetical protein